VPKGRLMAWMNGLKIVGAAGLLAGVHPVLVYAVVGLGAAAYAPAKYGLVTELVAPRQLVAANGWLEVSVVCAALLGTALGGLLVSALWPPFAGGPLLGSSLAAVLALYAGASLVNLAVPDSGARYAAGAIHPVALARDFAAANGTLWRDRDGGLSLAVTTLFWGVGATLQFVVLRWSADVLGLTLDRAAYLQAAVAVGVITGAAAAGRWVALAQARHMLAAGVVLGLMLPLVAQVRDVALATVLLGVTGAVGGLLVVPLNALLQHRGCQLLSAGRSIAVQGFNENASILAMLAVYALLLALDVPIVPLMWGLGLTVAAGMAALMAWRR
jgi:MFS transporter, LPLT family, lysophospholipid transporter